MEFHTNLKVSGMFIPQHVKIKIDDCFFYLKYPEQSITKQKPEVENEEY